MGERLKRGWIAYKKYKLVMRIIAAFVGAIVGISGCFVFAKVYHNYNAAVWAGVSVAFAILFIRLHFAVRRDHERLIPRSEFTIILWIGVVGFVAGIIGLITYIVLGKKHHEEGKATVRVTVSSYKQNIECTITGTNPLKMTGSGLLDLDQY